MSQTVYIFEDSFTSPISKVLINAYKDTIIEFSDGVSQIWKKAEPHLKSGKSVIAFIDLPIGNDEVINQINRLLDKMSETPCELKVVPIFCSEYYALQGFYNDDMCTYSKRGNIYDLLAITPYLERVFSDPKKKFRSTEKKCKKYLKDSTVGCFKRTDGHNCSYGKNIDYTSTVCPNLPCIYGTDKNAVCGTMNERSARYLKSLSCFPQNQHILREDEIICINCDVMTELFC